MKRKTVFKTGFLLFLYMGVVILMPSVHSLPIAEGPQVNKDFSFAAGESWLDGWLYRKQLDLDPVGDVDWQNFTYYQIELDINYGSGSDSGNSIYCNSNSETDFEDIRFTDDDGSTVLDYWIEEFTDSDDATMWVEVADDLASSQTIFIYYGNDAVSNVSSADDTFVFFDDFEDNDLTEWTDSTGCSIESSVVHTGNYAVDIPSGLGIYKDFGPYTFGILVHFQGYSSNTFRGIILQSYSSDTANDQSISFNLRETATSPPYYYDGTYRIWTGGTDIYNAATYYEIEVGFDNDYGEPPVGEPDPKMRLFMEGSYIGEEDHHETDDSDFDTENFGRFRIGSFSSYQNYADDVWVRKWSNVEPAISSFGEEEDLSDWQLINTASFVVVFGMSEATQWAFDNIIALVGLAMFVSSGVFLVYGGRKKFSIEKIFVAMCLFSVGLGIFIGSIVP